jgi:hypothetical protein
VALSQQLQCQHKSACACVVYAVYRHYQCTYIELKYAWYRVGTVVAFDYNDLQTNWLTTTRMMHQTAMRTWCTNDGVCTNAHVSAYYVNHITVMCTVLTFICCVVSLAALLTPASFIV